MLRKLLFRIAKSPLIGRVVGEAFQHGSWAIPVKKVYESRDVLAFRHPQPSYENHLILSPKRAVKDLRQLASDRFSGYFLKIWEAVLTIRAAHPEYHDAFVLVANGGPRQEVRQVHFHLFTHHGIVDDDDAQERDADIFDQNQQIRILKRSLPNGKIHFVIKPVGADQDAYFRSVLQSVALLNALFGLEQKGYSLVCQYRHPQSDPTCPVFHILSDFSQSSAPQ